MKKRTIIGLLCASFAMTFGIFSGLAMSKTTIKEAKAATTYYYRGEDNSWGEGTAVADDGVKVGVVFTATKKFKFGTSDWGSSLGFSKLEGTAKAYFSDPSDGDNILCNVSGTYDVTIKNSKLYIDLQDGTNFYYCGSATNPAWSNLTAKPVAIGGAAVQFTFTKDEQFKFRPGTDWTISAGWDQIDSDYYSCFASSGGDKNVYVKYTLSYDVTISTAADHTLNLKIVAHDKSSHTSYVLDLYNNRLHVARHAHYFDNSLGESNTVGTQWPGVEMTVDSGRIYSYTYLAFMNKVIFTNDGSNQTATLTAEDGKCFVLNEEWGGSWISIEAARFIDGYMHFNDYDENTNKGTTANCSTYYGAAKVAYNALSSNAVRKEVLSIGVVGTRLGWWAAANSDVIDAEGAQLSNLQALTILNNNDSNNIVLIIVIASTIALTSLGLFFFFKRKKEN